MSEDLLHLALRSARRRFRMPALAADPHAAAALDVDASLAYAIEQARLAKESGTSAHPAVRALFLARLGQLIRSALGPEGDAAFQALLLKAEEPAVARFLALGSQLAPDRRAMRSTIDAFAHPGKLRAMPEGPARSELERLHRLASDDAWLAVAQVATRFPELDQPALARLAEWETLSEDPAVQRYRALCERQGPLAGSRDAAAQGRASARVGDIAEAHAVHAFREIAALLGRGHAPYRVVRGLRTPAGFPGDATKAKDEWDAAMLRAGDNVALLAEVKVSPAAATPDYPRLLRGLLRLSHADAAMQYAFPSSEGDVAIAGVSLRALRPHGRLLPLNVIYCCTADADPQPQLLSAAAKAVLSGEPASIAFARQVLAGASPADESLAPVWDALPHEPRLRAALHQFETARDAREAMLHPDDLLAAVRDACGGA